MTLHSIDDTGDDTGVMRPVAHLELTPAFRRQYRLVRQLGVGASGMVILARSVSTGQELAVKILMEPGDETALRRFLIEREITAAIRSPHVVRVLDVGEMDGHPYLVMEHLPGGTLRQRLERRSRVPPGEAVSILQDCLAGLDACHAFGLVHRDLKPENILFDAGGRAQLADLGLAKTYSRSEQLTRTGSVLGTPRYMAPEQVRGEPVGVSTDIYAAATILYEMLSGRPPFIATTFPELVQEILTRPPAPLAPLVPGVSIELATVVEQALSKRLDERPASAADFADRLRRLSAPTRSRPSPSPDAPQPPGPPRIPPSRSGRSGGSTTGADGRRFVTPVTVAAVGATLLAAMAVAVLRGPPGPEALPAATSSRAATPRPGVMSSTGPLPAGALARAGTLGLRHGGGRCVASSPDGRILATGAADGRVHLWDALTGAAVGELPPPVAEVSALAFSPDGHRLAAGSGDRTVRVYDVPARKLVHRLEGPGHGVVGVAFSSDGSILAAATDEGHPYLWDAITGRERPRPWGSAGQPLSLAFSPGAPLLACGGRDGAIHVYNVASGRKVGRLEHGSSVLGISYSRDGAIMATGAWDGSIRIFDAAGRPVRGFLGHDGPVNALAVSPDARCLATGGEDKAIRLWDVSTGTRRFELTGRQAAIRGIAFTPDGKRLVAVSSDRTVRLFDVETGRPVSTAPPGHEGAPLALAFSHDGRWLASASSDRTVRIWEVAIGRQQLCLSGHAGAVAAVAFAPDDRTLASAGADEKIRIWEVPSGRLRREIDGHAHRVTSLAFSGDGIRLAAGGTERTARVWDAQTGELEHEIRAGGVGVGALAFSPDGTRLAIGDALDLGGPSRDCALRVLDVQRGVEIERFPAHAGGIHMVGFTEDGRVAGSAGGDGALRAWEIATGHVAADVRTGSEDELFLASSARRRLAVSGGRDHTFRLWDLTRGSAFSAVAGHAGAVTAAAFSPDGTILATGSVDTTILLWDATDRALVGP